MTDTVIEIQAPITTIVDSVTEQQVIDVKVVDSVLDILQSTGQVVIDNPSTQVVTNVESSIVNFNSLDTIVDIQNPATIITVQTGPKGDPGTSAAAFYYLHTQTISSAGWYINHNLGKIPNATILINDEAVSVPIHHIDENNIYIEFVTPQQGRAILS